MQDFNINMPRNKGIAIIVAVVVFALLGYILWFGAKGTVNEKEKENIILKEKASNAEANYNELKKQLDNSQDDLRQISKDHDALVEKHSECKIRLEENQSKSEEIMQLYDRCKKDLAGAQGTGGTSGGTTSTTPGSSSDTKKDENNTDTNKKDSSSANDTKTKLTMSCPSSQEVTLNAKLGQWQSEKLKWWVDYSSRPLNDGEDVKDLYKILFDGQSIACYYALGTNSDSVWMVVKGANSDKSALVLGSEGWTPCPTEECKSICEKDNLSKCHFGPNSTI